MQLPERQGREVSLPNRISHHMAIRVRRNVFLTQCSPTSRHRKVSAFTPTPIEQMSEAVRAIIRDIVRDCGGMSGRPMSTIANRAQLFWYHERRWQYELINREAQFRDNDSLHLAFRTPVGTKRYRLSRETIKAICGEASSRKGIFPPMPKLPQ